MFLVKDFYNRLTINRTVLILLAIGAAFSLLTFLIPFVLSESAVDRQVTDDSFIEYSGALGLAVGGFACLAAFYYSTSGNNLYFFKTKRNFIYLGLALILIFGAGEEISWGQRIFKWDTPDAFAENEQQETSIHNLPFFDSSDVGNLFTMNRMFLMFWFVGSVMVPLAAMYVPMLRRLFMELGVPIVPLVFGILMTYNYVVSKLYGPLGANRESYDGKLSEIREGQEGVMLMLIFIYMLIEVYAAYRAKQMVAVKHEKPFEVTAPATS